MESVPKARTLELRPFPRSPLRQREPRLDGWNIRLRQERTAGTPRDRGLGANRKDLLVECEFAQARGTAEPVSGLRLLRRERGRCSGRLNVGTRRSHDTAWCSVSPHGVAGPSAGHGGGTSLTSRGRGKRPILRKPCEPEGAAPWPAMRGEYSRRRPRLHLRWLRRPAGEHPRRGHRCADAPQSRRLTPGRGRARPGRTAQVSTPASA